MTQCSSSTSGWRGGKGKISCRHIVCDASGKSWRDILCRSLCCCSPWLNTAVISSTEIFLLLALFLVTEDCNDLLHLQRQCGLLRCPSQWLITVVICDTNIFCCLLCIQLLNTTMICYWDILCRLLHCFSQWLNTAMICYNFTETFCMDCCTALLND